MSSEEPFGPWVEPMERVGARNPRSLDGRVSWGGLARKAGVSTSAITNMVYGRTRTPSPGTVQKVAEALGVSPQTVSDWLNLDRPVGKTFEPDEASSLLYDHERAALNELIRAITRDRREAGEDRDERSAPMNPAGESPAQDDAPEGDVVEIHRRGRGTPSGIPLGAVANRKPGWRREADEREDQA